MKEQTIEEICDMLEYIAENNTVPRNIREVASNSSELLQNDEYDAGFARQRAGLVAVDPEIKIEKFH